MAKLNVFCFVRGYFWWRETERTKAELKKIEAGKRSFTGNTIDKISLFFVSSQFKSGIMIEKIYCTINQNNITNDNGTNQSSTKLDRDCPLEFGIICGTTSTVFTDV